MKLNLNVKSLKKSLNRMKFKTAKHSPEILLVAGTIGIVTSFVLGCVESTKVGKIVEEHKEKIDELKVAETKLKDGETLHTDDGEEYTEHDVKMDTLLVHRDTAIAMVKNYAPSVIIMTVSFGCIFKSHGIMNNRNAALAAAYAGVSQLFKEYRGRVVDKLGEEADKEFRHGVKNLTIGNVDEKGKETTKEIKYVDPTEYSPYAKFFDESNPSWQKDPEYNLMFLRSQQNYANDKLRADGILFLNEVYESIGLPKTKAGQVVGWVYDEHNPHGDNYVDFGIYDLNNEKARDFVNGYERSILLDFNVDGNVWDLMK